MKWRVAGFKDVSVPTLREMWSTFRWTLEGQSGALAGALGTTLVVTGLELVKPWPLKFVFDGVLIRDEAAPPPFGLAPEPLLWCVVGATVLIAILVAVFDVMRTVTVARIGRKIATRIRRQLFEHLHRLSLPFHSGSRSGDLLTRLMGDVNMVRDLIFASWISLLSRGSVFLGTTALLLILDPWIGLLALAPVPFLGFSMRRSGRKLAEVTRKQRKKEGGAASFAAETLRQIRVVKAFAAEDDAAQDFTRQVRSGERAGVKAARISSMMQGQTEVLTAIGIALVLLVGVARVADGSLTAGGLLVVLSYARSLYKPLRGLSKEGVRLAKATACAERILEILRREAETPDAGEKAPRFRGEVALEDVHYAYDGGRRALEGLSFRLPAGSLSVLAGENGSGKSTTMSLLLRLVAPTRGRFTIDGVDVSRWSLASYRRRFAYVPQHIQLFGGTIRENILYGRPDAEDADVARAASAAMLDPVLERLPDGLDTAIGEGGETLSGGEARRVMLARAALCEARLLLLDEPLAGIDPESVAPVCAAIRAVARGRTTLVVSHESIDALDPDRVITLAEGRARDVRERAREDHVA